MSYCVHCGVKLEDSLTECPLCNTPVVDPTRLNQEREASPFPKNRGQVDVVKRKDLAILLIVILAATAISCLLLNLFVFRGNMWSVTIIGICMLLFVFMIPAVLYTKLPIYCSIMFDAVAVGIYLYLLTLLTGSNIWFHQLALPIVLLATILVELFLFLLRSFQIGFLTTALYFFVEVALLCVGLELLIDHFLGYPLHLLWSAVVLTVCTVISIILITLLSRKRLRDAVRRRLHF